MFNILRCGQGAEDKKGNVMNDLEVSALPEATEEDLETLKRLIEEGTLFIGLDLWRDEPQMVLQLLLAGGAEPVARVRFQTLVSHDVFVSANIAKGKSDSEVCRTHLFSLAGRLRELAQIAEEQAYDLNADIANWKHAPMLEICDEED
jgi:hypothetical protein